MSSIPTLFDRVMETSTTTGTGAYTLAGAVTGFQSFAAVGDGNSCMYCAEEVDGNGNPSGGWEVGTGTYAASGTTLSRDTIHASSNGSSAVSWAAGTRRIYITQPASRIATSRSGGMYGPFLIRPKAVRVQGSNLSTGDTDLYTVPTGRRAIIGTLAVYCSGGNVGFYLQAKIGGTYYRRQSSATSTNNIGAVNGPHFGLEAGEILSISTSTNNGLNVVVEVIEFDADSALKIARLIGPSSGDNTLLTCPSGKTIAPLASSMSTAFGGWGATASRIWMVNDGGGSRSWSAYLVPSGQSNGSGYQFTPSTSAGANARLSLGGWGCLTAGDSIVVNVSVGDAAQTAELMYWEMDA